MNQRSFRRTRLTFVSWFALSALVSSGGWAATRAGDPDSPAGELGSPAGPSAMPAPVPPPGAVGEAPDPEVEPAPSSGSNAGVVERLPSSAYPQPFTRGIYGGSLWSTFHGLQWPYYRRTGIGISGYGWLDSSYERLNSGDMTQGQNGATKEYLQQGRLLLRVTPTYSSASWFVQAQAEFVANKDQSQTQPATGISDTDDLWIRTGQWQQWDVMVGRFEGFEVYHLGMGLDLNTEERRGAFDASNAPPDLYGASFLLYRPAGSGNVAFHLYPSRSLRVEVLAQGGSVGGLNEIGGRPALVYDIGVLKLKVAAEYQWLKARLSSDRTEKRNRGVGATAQVVLDPFIEFGVNAGVAQIDVFNNTGVPDTGNSGDLRSFGGFVNAVLMPGAILGLGVNYVTFENLHFNTVTGTNDRSTNLQTFAAAQYLIGRQLFVKLVGAYAKSHFEKSFTTIEPFSDTMYSVRLRVMYLF